MKEYPSIPQSSGQKFVEIGNAIIFDKLDGSSLRAEWTRKNGWYKFGRRHGLLDDTNLQLQRSRELFETRLVEFEEKRTQFEVTLAEALARLATDNRWNHLIVFYEFWGAKSLGGQHEEDDPKFLTVFDAAADKRGIISPREFRQIFEDKVPTPRYLGTHNWTRGFIEQVRGNLVPGVTFEGVVAKSGEGHKLVRAKAKTQQWIEAIRRRYGNQAESIINS